MDYKIGQKVIFISGQSVAYRDKIATIKRIDGDECQIDFGKMS